MTPRHSPTKQQQHAYHRYIGLNRRSCRLLFAILSCGFLSFWCILFITYDGENGDSAISSVLKLRRDVRAGVSPWTGTRKDGDSSNPGDARSTQLSEDVNIQIFPSCVNVSKQYFYAPGLLTSKAGTKIRRFTGRKLVPYISVYPADGTLSFSKRRNTNGNTIISTKVIDKLRIAVMDASYDQTSHFSFGDLFHVERMTLPIGSSSSGGRLFLLDVTRDQRKGKYHSEYVIDVAGIDTNIGSLCHPLGYDIRHDRKIYVIFTGKNLGQWVVRMIKEFEELHKLTGDDNFELIMADFNSSDADLKKIASKSVLSSKIRVLKMPHPQYDKLVGITTATDLVQNPEDIIFLCDLHLEIPSSLLVDIRKHVISSKMVFAPVVGKLDQGTTLDDPQGQWDTNGFGLIAMTKADWDMIGGMNTNEFSGDQWGGEDWEMIDRIIESGLLVNRRRVPGLFHHYHNKTGMWPGGRYQLMKG